MFYPIEKAKGLNDLKDTSIVTPVDGQAPIYNSTTQKWENKEVVTQDEQDILGAKNLFPNEAPATYSAYNVTGVTNEYGQITVNGTASGPVYVALNANFKLPAWKFIFTGLPDDLPTEYAYDMHIRTTDGDPSQWVWYTLDKDHRSIAFTSDPNRTYAAYISIPSGSISTNLVFSPMLRLESVNNVSYRAPSKTNAELTKYTRSIYNPNLLDNPWFTVNQRENVTYNTAWGLSVDRWRTDQNITLTVTNNGVQIANSHATDWRNLYMQVSEEDYKNLVGRPITMSVMLSDGTIKSGTITAPPMATSQNETYPIVDGGTLAAGIITIYNQSPIAVQYYIGVPAGGTLNIRAVKVELGTVSTLGLDTAPNYQQELAKCQRYYWRGHYAQYATVAEFDSSSSWTEIFIGVSAMRTTPVLTISGSIDYVTIGGETPWVAYSDLRVQEAAGEYVLGGNRGVSGSPTAGYCFSTDAGGTTIELSADL